jgi:hypothetical protein
MRRRVIGSTLTVLGVLVVLFKPYETVSLCARGCREQGSSDWRRRLERFRRVAVRQADGKRQLARAARLRADGVRPRRKSGAPV